jgi:hypothetical protein
LPAASGNISLIAAGGANDFGTEMQTFRNEKIKVMNPAATFGYIFATSAIIADRTITLPLLTGNDTLTLNDFLATLKNKTVNIDENTIKHSSTNAQGDILVYDQTAAKYIKKSKGTSSQVLKVKSDGTDIEWAAEAALGAVDSLYDNLKASSGFKYGLWEGVFDPGDAPDRGGTGLFANFDNIGGTPSAYIDTTNGYQGVSYPMTSGSANVGMRSLAIITIRKVNPDLTVCFQLDEGGDNTGSRTWIGFTGDLSKSAASDSYLDNDIGICLSKSSSDTNFKITSNDGDSTQDSTASVLATDSLAHTVRIYATEASSKWSYSIDGAAAVDVTTEIPTTTDTLGVIIAGSQSDSASRNFRPFWAKMRAKERA